MSLTFLEVELCEMDNQRPFTRDRVSCACCRCKIYSNCLAIKLLQQDTSSEKCKISLGWLELERYNEKNHQCFWVVWCHVPCFTLISKYYHLLLSSIISIIKFTHTRWLCTSHRSQTTASISQVWASSQQGLFGAALGHQNVKSPWSSIGGLVIGCFLCSSFGVFLSACPSSYQLYSIFCVPAVNPSSCCVLPVKNI